MSRILGGFWNEGRKKEKPEVMVHTLNCVIRAEATLQGGLAPDAEVRHPTLLKRGLLGLESS